MKDMIKKWLFKIEYSKRPTSPLSMPGGTNQVRIGFIEATEEEVENKIWEALGNDLAFGLQYWKITGVPSDDSYGIYKSAFD